MYRLVKNWHYIPKATLKEKTARTVIVILAVIIIYLVTFVSYMYCKNLFAGIAWNIENKEVASWQKK